MGVEKITVEDLIEIIEINPFEDAFNRIYKLLSKHTLIAIRNFLIRHGCYDEEHLYDIHNDAWNEFHIKLKQYYAQRARGEATVNCRNPKGLINRIYRNLSVRHVVYEHYKNPVKFSIDSIEFYDIADTTWETVTPLLGTKQESEYYKKQIWSVAREHIKTLSDDRQMVLKLKFIGYDYDEILRLVKVNKATARQWVLRTFRNIARIIQDLESK